MYKDDCLQFKGRSKGQVQKQEVAVLRTLVPSREQALVRSNGPVLQPALAPACQSLGYSVRCDRSMK
jgi:hypothetical protein